jgi:hypothetical protein
LDKASVVKTKTNALAEISAPGVNHRLENLDLVYTDLIYGK